MKILLLHPNDRVEDGPWQNIRWDWIVDLGWAGQAAYVQWAERFRCKAFSIRNVIDHKQYLSNLRELWKLDLGKWLDDEGVDWWDVFFPVLCSRIEEILPVSTLAGQIPPNAELAATRSHLLVQALSKLLHRDIKTFTTVRNGFLARYGKVASTFHPLQIMEIAGDKWDLDYRFRRYISPTPKPSTQTSILLPSSYINVSRAEVAYARMLPQQHFLLVTTRRNGGLVDLPANVELRSLASYASAPFLPATEKEHDHLVDGWRESQPKFSEITDTFNLANELGLFDGFPAFLKKGLRVRDAWRSVLSREPIRAVLSGDENNALTRLPTLLARSRGIHTVVCEHGALNVGFALRPPVSAISLAQGEMGRDYWREFCGVRHGQIITGGAAVQSAPRPQSNQRDWIVLFSEAYEANFGRTEDFYAEILPQLCLLANQTGRKVVIKLHPFESLRARTRIVRKSLPRDLQPLVELREGPLTPDFFDRAWFSLTVESSVAVECTLKGIPCFLCHWFDGSWYEYGAQFGKFSAGRILNSPEDISKIPELLEGFEIDPVVQQRLATQIRPEHLQAVLSGSLLK